MKIFKNRRGSIRENIMVIGTASIAVVSVLGYVALIQGSIKVEGDVVSTQQLSGATLHVADVSIDANNDVTGIDGITVDEITTGTGTISGTVSATTLTGGTVTAGGNKVNMSNTGAIKWAPVAAYGILCIDSGSNLGYCTTISDAVGNCDCTAP